FDLDAAHLALDDAAHEIDIEQTVVERGAGHLDTVGQYEGALELARGDAAMKVDAILVVGLLAAHDELIVLDLHAQIVHGEAGDGERDAQRVLAGLLDIVGRIAVARRLADAIEGTLELIESQKQRRVEERETRHRISSSERVQPRDPSIRRPSACGEPDRAPPTDYVSTRRQAIKNLRQAG